MGAGSPANTGEARAMHRVGFFAAKAAPTGYSERQRSPKGWVIPTGARLRPRLPHCWSL
ncbi:Diguanylate cyclase (fragment) [Pseudomonas sp. JV551A1]|uniref:Diguanylate cyclase n=1 Tax=Pseudomonas inefficax TaxID=2078786 RepID=A0AAQ1PEL4_9PSED